jgi:RimJ/RimL family protein N-acetyltransferase
MSVIEAELIATPRLDLLPIHVDHAEEMAGVLADPALYTFIGGHAPTSDELRSRYARQVAGSTDPGEAWCNWVILFREGGSLAGTVQATITDEGTASPLAEVAWVVGTPWQGKGIATEAALGLIGWLEQRSVSTVIAHINPRNHASEAVAAAAGFTPTDHIQDGEVRWRRTATPR